MDILVSVIVPVYNMGSSLEKCVNSILKQTYNNLEIILVDDGSKDDSYERCQKLTLADSRVHAFHTENRGSGPARNHGIINSSGTYLYFPDADDYLEPDAIFTLVNAATKYDADMVVCGYRSVDVKGKVIFEKKYPVEAVSGEEMRNNYAFYKVDAPQFGLKGAPWNKLFRGDTALSNKVEYPPLRRHQDEAFIARYLCYAKKIVFIDRVLYTHYTNDQKTEWNKYPVDYIDAVRGLYEDRKKNILTWNPEDQSTHDMVLQEYISNIIKAFELTFSPKFGFDKKQRVNWIKAHIDAEILNVEVPNSLGRYQRCILNLIKSERMALLYAALNLKVCIAEKVKKK